MSLNIWERSEIVCTGRDFAVYVVFNDGWRRRKFIGYYPTRAAAKLAADAVADTWDER